MLEVLVNHIGDAQFEIKARQHTVYCDQPFENGGFDEGMTPPEFMLASVGACAGFYAVQYLKANKLPMGGLTIRTTAEKASKPARLAAFHIEVNCPSLTEEKHRRGVLEAVYKCLIHNTLLHPPKIDVTVNGKNGSAALAA
jgi:putative redox protein